MRRDGHGRPPLVGVDETLWVLGSTVLISLAGAGLNILVGNVFNGSGLGVYTLMMTIYLAAGTIAGIGLPGAVTKFATEHRFSPDIERRYLSASLFLAILGSIVVSFVLWGVRKELASLLNAPQLAEMLTFAIPGLPCFAVNKMLLARIRGMRRIRNFAIGESWRMIFIVLTTLAVMVWRPSLEGAAAALTVSEAALACLLLWLGRVPGKIVSAGTMKSASDLVVYGKRILLSRMFLELDGRIAFLLAGFFFGPEQVGILSVAFLFSQALTLLPTALQKVTGPVITELHLDRRRHELAGFLERSIANTLFVQAGTAMILWWLFPRMVSLLYPGKEAFMQALTPFGILAVGLVMRGGVGAVGSVFVSIGRPDVVMKLSPVRLLLNLAVSLLLIKPLGISGIAAGTSVTGMAVFFLWVASMEGAADVHVNLVRLLLTPGLALLLVVAAGFMSGRFVPGWVAGCVALSLYLLAGLVFRWKIGWLRKSSSSLPPFHSEPDRQK